MVWKEESGVAKIVIVHLFPSILCYSIYGFDVANDQRIMYFWYVFIIIIEKIMVIVYGIKSL